MTAVEPARRTRRRTAAELAAVAACATTVWLLFVHTWVPADFRVFLRAGHAVGRGLSPYVNPNSAAVWSGKAFVYPYLAAWWFVPFTWLPRNAAELTFYVASVAALGATVWLLGDRQRRLVTVLLVFTAEPVVRSLQLGTLNVWLLLGLAIAWRARRRPVVVVAALTCLIVAKLFLLPMLAWLLITRRPAVAATSAALSAALILIGCTLADLPVQAFVHMLSELSLHEAPQSSSVTSVLLRVGVGDAVATDAVVVLAAAIVAGSWWRFRHTGDERGVFCSCVVAALVLTPIVWTHYLALLLVIPLIWRWSSRLMLGLLAVSWLRYAPGGLPVLARLHRAPDLHPVFVLATTLLLLAMAVQLLRCRANWVRPQLASEASATLNGGGDAAADPDAARSGRARPRSPQPAAPAPTPGSHRGRRGDCR